MEFEEKHNDVEWHMLPILLAKYGGSQKFDPIFSHYVSIKPHNINNYSDREKNELSESRIRFSITSSDLKICFCKVNLFLPIFRNLEYIWPTRFNPIFSKTYFEIVGWRPLTKYAVTSWEV